MPQNKREDWIFTVMMVFAMAFCMATYNMLLTMGFQWDAISMAWSAMPITFLVCFLLEHFFVTKLVGLIVKKIVKPTTKPLLAIVTFQFFTVCIMVILMSFYGALMIGITNGFEENLMISWLHHIPLNFIVALPLQVLVLGPAIRFLFRKLFPVGKVTA